MPSFLLIVVGLLDICKAPLLSPNFAQIGFDNSLRLVLWGSLVPVDSIQIA